MPMQPRRRHMPSSLWPIRARAGAGDGAAAIGSNQPPPADTASVWAVSSRSNPSIPRLATMESNSERKVSTMLTPSTTTSTILGWPSPGPATRGSAAVADIFDPAGDDGVASGWAGTGDHEALAAGVGCEPVCQRAQDVVPAQLDIGLALRLIGLPPASARARAWPLHRQPRPR
jgi:hypothetical protein